MKTNLTRRAVLGSAVAGLAGLGPAAARGQDASTKPAEAAPAPAPAPAPASNVGVYHTRVGGIRVTMLSDGTFNFNPMHPSIGGNVDADLFSAAAHAYHIAPDGYAHVNALLVRKADRVILVDAGSGDTFAPTCGRLIANLAAAGVAPADVTDILVTHAHLDHVGGLTLPGEPTRLTFPNAAVHLADAERDFWQNDPNFEKSGVPEAMQAGVIQIAVNTLDTAKAQLQTVTPGREVLPGITAVAAPGHTPGHTAYLIEDADDQLLFVGDLIFAAPLLTQNPDWYVDFDTDMAAAAATRFRMMDMIATDRLRICGSHLSFPALGHLRRDASGFAYLPETWRFEG